MTEQERLREALRAAVPEPPTRTDRGRAARAQAARSRRTRGVTALALAAVVVAGGVALWPGHRPGSAPPANGTGETACRALAHSEKGGRYVDSRVVDGATASAWLARVAAHIDASAYRNNTRVTACLTSVRNISYLQVIGTTGPPVEVVHGALYPAKYGGLIGDMTLLDRLWKGGKSTTDAPFTCAGSRTERYRDVTTTLPAGATAARICFDGEFFQPSQTLTQDVDTLVNEVNAAPIEYVSPDFNCSGAEGDYGFTIVFRYPSGTRSVSEETCRGLALGAYTRAARVKLDPLYLSLLARQVGAGPGSTAAPPCRTSPSDRPEGVGDIRNIIAARYCPSRAGGPGRALDGSQLRQLRSWGRSYLGATTEPDHPAGRCSRPAAGWPELSLADAWGDRFTVVLVGCSPRLFPGAVNWGAPDKVIYPLGFAHPVLARLARELAAGLG